MPACVSEIWYDREKVAPDPALRQVAMREAQGAVGCGGSARKGRVALGQQRLLHLAGQRQFHVHLLLLLGQRLGIGAELLRLVVFLRDVARDAAGADDFSATHPAWALWSWRPR